MLRDLAQSDLLPEDRAFPDGLLYRPDWIGVEATEFVQALVSQYQPGTPFGWHRDVPDYELIAGVSLATPAGMRFRPYPPRANKREGVFALELEPRSAYVLASAARWKWQHSVSPTAGLRYSITFRTKRRGPH